MVFVIERKDGTHILCAPRTKRRPSRRRLMAFQLVIAVTCLSLGIWLLLT